LLRFGSYPQLSNNPCLHPNGSANPPWVTTSFYCSPPSRNTIFVPVFQSQATIPISLKCETNKIKNPYMAIVDSHIWKVVFNRWSYLTLSPITSIYGVAGDQGINQRSAGQILNVAVSPAQCSCQLLSIKTTNKIRNFKVNQCVSIRHPGSPGHRRRACGCFPCRRADSPLRHNRWPWSA
jgi:hypothetical protein